MARLEDLLKYTQTISVQGPRDHEILGVACDSRQVRPGFLFVAVSGSKDDGRRYAEDAMQRGAVAVASEAGAGPVGTTGTGRQTAGTTPRRDSKVHRMDVCQVVVKDSRLALAELAVAFHGNPSARLRVAGITGTNGKTTTAYMIRDIWRVGNLDPGLISTVEYAVGARSIPAARTTPDAASLQSMLAQMVAAGCRGAVMEVSSHALHQKRTAGVDYDVAVFTNLTRDHLDYHRTLEDYFQAKSRLFLGLGSMKKHAVAVVNADDPWGERLRRMEGIRASIVTYGIQSPADVRAEALRLGPGGSSFTVRSPWGSGQIDLQLLGRYNVSNALAALAACASTGSRLDEVIEALQRVTLIPGRLERIQTRRGVQVFVDYAHTEDALDRALEALREIAPRRLIVVFGCGGDRDKGKRPAMGRVAARRADVSLLTSDNPRTEPPARIIDEIRAGFDGPGVCEVIEDRARAIERALEIAEPGDLVLVAGKGHETFQECGNRTVPFDDRQIVRKYS